MRDFGGTRPLLEQSHEPCEPAFVSLCDHLDRSIRCITHIADYIQLVRGLPCEVAEAHALYAAVYPGGESALGHNILPPSRWFLPTTWRFLLIIPLQGAAECTQVDAVIGLRLY